MCVVSLYNRSVIIHVLMPARWLFFSNSKPWCSYSSNISLHRCGHASTDGTFMRGQIRVSKWCCWIKNVNVCYISKSSQWAFNESDTVHLLQGHSPWTNLDFSALLKGMMGIASNLSFFHFTKKWKFCHVGPLMSAE